MLYLFICIAIGFALRRGNLIPENSGATLAKLENWVFCPALSFLSMVRSFSPETVKTHATNLLLSRSVFILSSEPLRA